MNNVIDLQSLRIERQQRALLQDAARGRLVAFKRPLRPEELLLQRMRWKGGGRMQPPINPELLGGFGW